MLAGTFIRLQASSVNPYFVLADARNRKGFADVEINGTGGKVEATLTLYETLAIVLQVLGVLIGAVQLASKKKQ